MIINKVAYFKIKSKSYSQGPSLDLKLWEVSRVVGSGEVKELYLKAISYSKNFL